MNKPKVLVTRKWPSGVEQELAKLYDTTLNESDRPLTAEQLQQAMQDYDAVLSTVTDPITAEILNTDDKRTKIIGNFGVGYNNIDINAAKQNGIIVTNTPGVLTDCTADIAMLLILMSARRAGEGERMIRKQQWQGWAPTQLLGQKVTGKTLGLIGFGRIARALAHKAHFGFAMNIIFFTPHSPAPEVIEHFQAQECANIDQVLISADFVSLHCPGGDSTYHLINENNLKLMRPDAHLINTARGDVVDNQALIKALQARRIAGAGLDVFAGEPNIDDAFLDLDNVTLLPHIGSASEETRTAMGNRVLANIGAYFAGEQPGDRVV